MKMKKPYHRDFENIITNMHPKTLYKLNDIMVDVSIAFEYGDDHRAVLTKYKNMFNGRIKEICTYLLSVDEAAIRRMSAAISTEFENNQLKKMKKKSEELLLTMPGEQA